MTQPNNDKSSRVMPPVGEYVIVQCHTFSCLGYLDNDGKWKSAFSNKELPEVIRFEPLDPRLRNF